MVLVRPETEDAAQSSAIRPGAYRPWSLGNSHGCTSLAFAPVRCCTSRKTSAKAGSLHRSSSLKSSTSGTRPPRRCRRAAARACPSKCSMVPKTRCASARGAPGHDNPTISGAARSSANVGARSATTAGARSSAAVHSSSSPYHHRTRPKDSGDVITSLTADRYTRPSSRPWSCESTAAKPTDCPRGWLITWRARMCEGAMSTTAWANISGRTSARVTRWTTESSRHAARVRWKCDPHSHPANDAKQQRCQTARRII